MEISIFLNPTISIGASIGLFFLLKHFIPKYFEKKAENLATKEDIGEITTIVESIKQQNNKELEFIKSELFIKTKAQQAIYDDERQAIILYIENTVEFYETHICIPNVSPALEGINYFEMKLAEFDNAKTVFQKSSAKLQLFCFDNLVLEKAEIIKKNIFEMMNYTHTERQKYLIKLNQMLALQNKNDNIKIYNHYESELQKIYDEYETWVRNKVPIFNKNYEILQDFCKDYLRVKHNIN